MDKFNNTIITNAGRKLLNNVSGGQGKITYTKAVLYNQDISSLSDEDLMALTSLSGDVVTTNISIVKVTDTTVTAEASFTNAKLTQDVTFNAIGWFASVVPGDDETLIAVTPSATTQTLVAGSNGKATASVDFKLLMGISHDAQVNLTTNEAGTIDQTHLDNALRDLAAKGLINQGEDIGNDVDISQIHNTSIQTANGTDLTNMPKDYSNHGYLISIGSNDTTKDGIHVLYDTQKNIQYVQYFNNKTNKWTDWLANSTEQDLKDLKKSLDNYYTKAEVDGKLSSTGKVKTVNHANPDDSGNIQIDTGVTRFNGQTGDVTFKVVHDDYDSPQAAFDASKTEDGIHIYDPDNGPTSAVVDGETITVSKNHDDIVQLQQQQGDLQGTVNGKADKSDVTTLQARVTSQETEIADLKKNSLKIVACTQEEYDALEDKDPDIIYAIGG